MKVLNIGKKVSIGKRVIAIKDFVNGLISVKTGDCGIITNITIESFPDLNLFNIKILHMDFGKYQISMGEKVALNYFNIV